MQDTQNTIFSDPLYDKVDQLLGIIISVAMTKTKENIIVVDYPYDVPTWATYGIALQVAGLTNKKVCVFNPSVRLDYIGKVKKAGNINMIFSYKTLEAMKVTRFYSEMYHNISKWTLENTDFAQDIFPLLPHDYTTAAVIAYYYNCPSKYITQNDIDFGKVFYLNEGRVINVDKI